MKSKTYNEKLGVILVIACVILMIVLILLALELGINPLFGMVSALAIIITLIFVLPNKWFVSNERVR